MLTDDAFRKGLLQFITENKKIKHIELVSRDWLIVFRPNVTTICDSEYGLDSIDPIFTTTELFIETNIFSAFIDELYARNIKAEVYDFIEAQLLMNL